MPNFTAENVHAENTVIINNGKHHIPDTYLFQVDAPETCFTGRPNDLHRLHQFFSVAVNEKNIGVVYGMGGVGKTQLARKFIKLNRVLYSNFIWIHSGEVTSIEQSFAKLSKELILPLKDADGDRMESESVIARVLERFCERKTLFVYDNVDNPESTDYLKKLANEPITLTGISVDHSKSSFSMEALLDSANAFAISILMATNSTGVLATPIVSSSNSSRPATAFITRSSTIISRDIYKDFNLVTVCFDTIVATVTLLILQQSSFNDSNFSLSNISVDNTLPSSCSWYDKHNFLMFGCRLIITAIVFQWKSCNSKFSRTLTGRRTKSFRISPHLQTDNDFSFVKFEPASL
ncbi:hypothetical protein HA402_000573 [Bradysia odoriphaga]|nr:hypothetical protein HA402_000573 [Bradysia odoriphaga]